MRTQVLKIKKTSDVDWYVLPTPMTIQGGSKVLDGANSGRDNNTGIMYRDIVRSDVATYTCTLPEGLDNFEMAEILDIILSESYNMYIPDIRTGLFSGNRNFYTASADPQISEIKSVTAPEWYYAEYSFEAVEL